MEQLKNSGPIVLAFSGGLDTCAILTWLKQTYNRDVIAYCANVGEDGPDIAARARELGAVDFIMDDLQEEFTSDYVWPLLKSGATYQKDYLLGTALARPLIAEKMAAVAKAKGASAIAHGATGKGNDQLRFEQTWSLLIPDIPIIAPWKTWEYKGREDLLNYLGEQGVSYDFPNKTFSIDGNLLHTSYEGGPLESLATDPFTVLDIEAKETKTAKVDFGIVGGEVVEMKIDDQPVASSGSKAEILIAANKLGLAYGIGIEDIVEERVNGIKSRGVYLTPGGTLIKYAIDQLKQVCWDIESFKLAESQGSVLGGYIYQGDWFCPATQALLSMYEQLTNNLTGEVVVHVRPYHLSTASRSAKGSLYSQDLVSFETDEADINAASVGYCKTRNSKYKQLGQVANLSCE